MRVRGGTRSPSYCSFHDCERQVRSLFDSAEVIATQMSANESLCVAKLLDCLDVRWTCPAGRVDESGVDARSVGNTQGRYRRAKAVPTSHVNFMRRVVYLRISSVLTRSHARARSTSAPPDCVHFSHETWSYEWTRLLA